MATIEFIDGRIVEHVPLSDMQHVGEEGSRRAIAHIDGKEYWVYNSCVDGFDPIWYEQMSLETYKMLKGSTGFPDKFVEGSGHE